MFEIQDVHKITDLLNEITEKIRRIIDEDTQDFPFSKDLKTGRWTGTNYCDWSGGHWVGLLTRAYEWSKDETFLKEAKKKLGMIAKRVEDNDEFLGFIFRYSYAHLSEVLKSEDYEKLALKAADKLLEIQNKKNGLIPLGSQCKILGTGIKGEDLAGVDDAIIPNTLLFWAYKRTLDERYIEVAIQNLNQSIKLFMREDGSTIHMIRFNPENGDIIQKWNNLGFDSTTTWSRGQAFFLLALAYGFNATRQEKYSEAYTKGLSFYLSVNKDKDLTPYYDMTDPNIPNVPKDTSSLAILAESFLLMVENGYNGYNLLRQILDSLISHIETKNESSVILKDGCFDYPRNIAIYSELIFADYYCYDFLLRLRDYLKVMKIE
ncbi:MAG: glycoside hydrolase family 88 protein [Thermoplasmatales archaeon]|nr:glycoside hydrolase family 88 protein [Thermoplasmatales archaeon]MCW6170351.1 glycoside hydrolase family 88 protein [Thermoplasmatales archaeon]